MILMYYYLNNFLFFAILGFVYENVLQLIFTGDFTTNPFYGPWMPIYGFGVIIMIFLTRLIFNNLKINRWLKIIILFIIFISQFLHHRQISLFLLMSHQYVL